ncbi:MAG: DNA cytosine methyltransferase [Bacteroidia bacterium]
MTILSLFDGIGVTAQALKKLNIPVEKYYASEIDPYAIKVAMLNHPDIIQLGDIRTIKGGDLPPIDLLIFGFPCQDLSSIGKGAGLNGERSGLFYEALRLLAEVKPKHFIAENVASMPLSERNKISALLGVEPIMINSALFASGQCRKRLFWCNFKVTLPTDQGIKLQDIITNGFVDRDKSHALLTNQLPETEVGLERYLFKSTGQLVFKEKYFAELDKPTKLVRFKNMQKLKLNKADKCYKNGVFRHISVNEAEALQTLPQDYTAGISKSQRFKCLGNSFTCDVIAHLLSFIKIENQI